MAEPKKLPSGKWQVHFRYKDPITDEWKLKKITRKTKKETNEAKISFLSDIQKGQLIENITLLDFFDLWVETFKKGKVTEGRMQKFDITRKNLKDFFGEKQTVKGINKISYQKWVNWLATPGMANERGLSIETVSDRHNIVKSMFFEAIDMQYIQSNPTRNIRVSGQIPEHASEKTISLENTKKLLPILKERDDSTSKFFVLTQLYTGCRYQEVAALKWDDLLEETEQIRIERAFKYAARQKSLGSTKSEAGVRLVDVPLALFQELKKHKRNQNRQMLRRELKNPQHFIFCNSKDTWPISNTAVNNYLKKICAEAKIPRISTHAFRHGRIDALILAEADPIYIKSQIGHKDISQSWDYASATRENREKNKEKTQSFLKEIL